MNYKKFRNYGVSRNGITFSPAAVDDWPNPDPVEPRSSRTHIRPNSDLRPAEPGSRRISPRADFRRHGRDGLSADGSDANVFSIDAADDS